MIVTIVGGDQNGQTRDLFDGSQAWVDLRNGDTFRIRRINWVVTGADGKPSEVWKLPVAVHPEIINQGQLTEQQIVTGLVQEMAMTYFMRGNAESVEIEPAPADPSPLFGADGRPIGS
jgi:hypothetical protein